MIKFILYFVILILFKNAINFNKKQVYHSIKLNFYNVKLSL